GAAGGGESSGAAAVIRKVWPHFGHLIPAPPGGRAGNSRRASQAGQLTRMVAMGAPEFSCRAVASASLIIRRRPPAGNGNRARGPEPARRRIPQSAAENASHRGAGEGTMVAIV